MFARASMVTNIIMIFTDLARPSMRPVVLTGICPEAGEASHFYRKTFGGVIWSFSG